MKKTFFTPQNITLIGVMTALGTVIYMFFPEVPLIPGVEHLKIDFSDIPAILAGVAVHPLCGIAVEVLKNLVHLLKTTTMGVGELMNVCIGSLVIGTLCGGMKLGAKLFKKERFDARVYFTACGVTLVAAVVGGWLLNWLLTPVFYAAMGWPLTQELLLAGVFGSTLLNVIKTAINLLPFYPLYHGVAKLVKHMS